MRERAKFVVTSWQCQKERNTTHIRRSDGNLLKILRRRLTCRVYQQYEIKKINIIHKNHSPFSKTCEKCESKSKKKRKPDVKQTKIMKMQWVEVDYDKPKPSLKVSQINTLCTKRHNDEPKGDSQAEVDKSTTRQRWTAENFSHFRILTSSSGKRVRCPAGKIDAIFFCHRSSPLTSATLDFSLLLWLYLHSTHYFF